MPSNLRSVLLKAKAFLSDPMRRAAALIAVALVVATLTKAAPAQSPDSGSLQPGSSSPTGALKSAAAMSLARLPLGFELNKGQMDPAVKYAARGSQYTVFLTRSEAVFALPVSTEVPTTLKSIVQQGAARQVRKPPVWTSVGMRLVGANPAPMFTASDQLPGTKNYFVGRDTRKWTTGVPLYSRVESGNIYPGIDLAFRGIEKELEFDFLVSPGADPRRIKMAFEGAQHIKLETSGDLIVSSTAGDLRIHRPVAYQEAADGKRTLVPARFVERRDRGIQLALGSYDRRRRLIIDPSVTYATYLGGVAQDEGLGVATDGGGNTFLTGGTNSPDFPNTGGGLSYQGGFDAFVTAFNSSGQLLFSTLFGGSGDDVGTSVAVNPVGFNPGIFVTGYTTSTDFPAFVNQTQLAGTQNAFVCILEYPTGYFTMSSTYLGGEAVDSGLAVTFDNAGIGYVYVAGQTTSQSFPISSPLFNETQLNMGGGSGASDGFVTELYPDLSGFYFSTFLGGANQDFAAGIALDNPDITNHHIYITGGTASGGSTSPPSFYTTPGVIQPTCGTDGNCNGGQDDAFVTVICNYQDPPCNAIGLAPNYVYSTFLGGSSKDDAFSIAADLAGNAYITGQTASTDFKLANPLQGTLKGLQNAFISKLNPTGTSLVFSTYLGGSGTDAGLGLAIDDNSNVYITGRTNSSDFPLQFPTQGTIGGGTDAFISAVNSSGSALTFSTFLGGSGDEDVIGGSIAVDSSQNVYVTGDTNSTNFPTQNAYQSSIGSTENCTIGGNQVLCPDAFVAVLNVVPPSSSTLTVTVNGGPNGAEGSVSSEPAGIDQCSDNPNDPGICSASFANGTLVTLTATPINDAFSGWSGDAPSSCGMNLTCQIQITTNANVIANFSPVSELYSLAVQGAGITGSLPGTGTITSSPAGINCGTGGQICNFDFAQGTQVTLTATADPGSYFYGWSANLACSGTGLCVIVMSSNQTVDYTFLSNSGPPPLPDFTLTVTPTSLGVVPIGSQGVAGIAIGTLNGFTDTVNLSCSVKPASASSPSCTVTPSSLTIPLNGAGSATLAVNTTGLAASRSRHSATDILAFSVPFLGALLGAGVKSRYRRGWRNLLRLLLGFTLLGVMAFQLACGGSGGGSQGGVAQAGSYEVTITGQGQTTLITHTVQVAVTIQ